MTTVASTLKMYDQMTGVLKGITSSLHMTLTAMDDMQRSMDKSFDSKAIDAARKSIQQTEAALKKIDSPISDNIDKQEKFNDELKNGERSADSLAGKIAGFVGAYVGIKTVTGFFQAANAAASEQIAVEQRLQTIMGNINGMTQDGIELVKQRARELEGTTAISAGVGIAGQSQLAEYVYDPTNIAGMSEAMYNLATETYGANVSADQLQQTANLLGKVMMGDINALSRNGFKIDAIFTEAEQKLLKTGTEAERAAMVISMIDENLSGLAEAMGNTPEGQAIKLANAWGGVQEKIGYGVIPMLSMLTSFIMENMPVIESIFVNVFGNVLTLLMNVSQFAINAASFIIDNWSWIAPIISGIAVAVGGLLLAIYGVNIATKIWAVTQAILNAVMNTNPIFLIITLIAALVVAIISLWQKNDAFAAGLMCAWNSILNFFDQIPIFFVRVGLGIVNAIQDAKVESLRIMELLVNGVIDGVNWLIEKLNKIPGVSLKAIDHVEFTSKAAAEAEAIRQAGEEMIAKMEESAAEKADKREQKVLDMLKDRAEKREEEEKKKNDKFTQPEIPGAGSMPTGAWDVGDGTLINGGKLDEVGKVKDTVDISSEDLKTMRELAEMKNIQNFVTLQPQFTFGDTNIRQDGRSVDEIVSNIAELMEQEIASTARGVYA